MLDYGEDKTKAGRSELVILDLATAQIIQNFIDECRGNLIGRKHKEQDQGYLFPSKAGRCLAKSSMWLIVREITRSTIGKQVHPHLWRSIFDSHVLYLAAIGIGRACYGQSGVAGTAMSGRREIRRLELRSCWDRRIGSSVFRTLPSNRLEQLRPAVACRTAGRGQRGKNV